MKKILFWILVVLGVLFLLAACSSTAVGISELEKIPREVQPIINSEKRLQLVSFDEDAYYVVFHSTGTVTANTEASEDTLNILLEVVNQQDEELTQHVYKLILAPEHEIIDVQINGQTVHFDEVTGLN
ncbi:hypothetical protein JTF06_13030 [Desemzia sp. RIT804]|uniref:hypothetical protein n=1 Tax=Desemzia sp. RIT 804 TaxID=2810209 RepID=UPI0019503991|nr:hypothetical protein [Desemzia sp. RIT 804]MBM6615810.1 hypothetical protein [Desemzia sp. RIT 804]